jgi:hypothetical protein
MGAPLRLRVLLWLILASNAIKTKVVELTQKITPVFSILMQDLAESKI